MRFETKFGIGEIVSLEMRKGEKLIADALLEVIGITIHKQGVVIYSCRWPSTGYVQAYVESELVGDPEFDQEAGCYPCKNEGSESEEHF